MKTAEAIKEAMIHVDVEAVRKSVHRDRPEATAVHIVPSDEGIAIVVEENGKSTQYDVTITVSARA